MSHYKLPIHALLLTFVLSGTNAYAQKFQPDTAPIAKIPHAKPNIHMMLDDSGSMMTNTDVFLEEHAEGFGLPVCQNQSNEWHAERKALGEYDPFQTGTYIPWDEYKAVDGWIGDKKRPPKISQCQKVTRSKALDYAVQSVLHKYRDNAYLGISLLWQVNNNESEDPKDANTLLRVPIDDYSTLSSAEFDEQVVKPISTLLLQAYGNTPMYPAVYEAIKMYRGQPMNASGGNGGGVGQNEKYGASITEVKQDGQGRSYYNYVQQKTPLRYRCQENHMIVMTDGLPNRDEFFGIGVNDKLLMQSMPGQSLMLRGINLSSKAEKMTSQDIGRITSQTDLRKAYKPILVNGEWVEKIVDDAGKDWNDELSVKMPIFMHSVSLNVDPKSSIYTGMTAPTNGFNLGFGENEGGTAEDLLYAFDTIFAAIIRATSSTLGATDRLHGEVLEGRPEYSGNAFDMSTVGTIRYDTSYNFNQRFGNLRAMVPYIDEYDEKGNPVILLTELWSTDDTVNAADGRYVTFLDDKNKVGKKFSRLTDEDVKAQFKKIYESTNIGGRFDDSYITWLTNFEEKAHQNNLRTRTKPMGSITNSDILIANKDVLNINIASNKMSQDLSKELLNYLKYKAVNQPLNYVIVGDNDGFINFINAQRGLTNRAVGGALNTVYFPQLFMHRIDEIAKDNRPATLVMEGRANLVDGKVYQKNIGHMYANIGLSGMGSGGKGVVGYRIYAVSEKDMKSWTGSQASKIDANDPIDKILPLFEITNQGPPKYRTKGFEDLGYTYSGFGFFNRVTKGNNRGQIVGIFGNGFGADSEKSVLYFIDAYTGEKLHEIVVNTKGGGLATPEVIVTKDPDGNGQALDRIYVGDYSGTLYKIDFDGNDFTNNNKVEVTALFQAPKHIGKTGQSAISTKPLVTKNNANNLYQISFGTGNASSTKLDRGKNSLVEHSIYSVIDNNENNEKSTKTVAELLTSTAITLSPLLKKDDLKIGKVQYLDPSKVDYLTQSHHALIIETPIQKNPENTKDNGWAIRLIADGTKSGERVIQDPRYDSVEDSIVFSTWGIYEQNLIIDKDIDDPCLKDAIFGKVLSFNTKNGSGGKAGKKGIQSQAVTDRAQGGLTGEGIQISPEGNQTTDLSQLDDDALEDLLEIMGGENSTYYDNPKNPTLQCIGGIYGKTECIESGRAKKKKLTKKRISVKEIYRY